jgi:hypothetical protein
LAALFLMKIPAFKGISMLICLFTLLCFVYLEEALEHKSSRNIATIVVGLNGFFNIAIYSVIYEWAVLVSPGIGEGLSCGILNMIANLFGFSEILLV